MYEVIGYDFEVFKYNWLVVFINKETNEKTVIIDNPTELKDFYIKHKEAVFVGYNSRNYDQFIFKGILCSQNPAEINHELIVNGKRGYSIVPKGKQYPINNYDVSDIQHSLKQLEAFMGHTIKETSVDFTLDRPLTDEEMIFLLKRTARAEKIKMDTEVYERIAELAKGGSRKGMKLLAKVLYLENDEERLNALKGNSDDEENPETIEFCRALSKKTDFKTLTSLLAKIDLTNAETVRMAVMGYMNACILKGNPSAEIVATMQAFSSADTYRNSKFALTVALLDREDLLG